MWHTYMIEWRISSIEKERERERDSINGYLDMNKHDDLTSKQKTLTIAINLTLVSMAFFFFLSQRYQNRRDGGVDLFQWLAERERERHDEPANA
jgi:hypothetical protein